MAPLTSETQLQNESSVLLDDRRRRERTPPLQEGTHIWVTGNRRISVEVIDQSAGGLGVIIPDVSFNLGPFVDIEYDGERRPATVAYLSKTDNGQYRLGLEWVSLREV